MTDCDPVYPTGQDHTVVYGMRNQATWVSIKDIYSFAFLLRLSLWFSNVPWKLLIYCSYMHTPACPNPWSRAHGFMSQICFLLVTVPEACLLTLEGWGEVSCDVTRLQHTGAIGVSYLLSCSCPLLLELLGHVEGRTRDCRNMTGEKECHNRYQVFARTQKQRKILSLSCQTPVE